MWIVKKKKKRFSTHKLRVFLTLLCEDASLHKTSRQANKFVYLHIFSPECQLVESEKRSRRDSARSVLKAKQPYAHQRSIWLSRTEDRTGKCSSGRLYGCRVCAVRSVCSLTLSAHHLSPPVLQRWEGLRTPQSPQYPTLHLLAWQVTATPASTARKRN